MRSLILPLLLCAGPALTDEIALSSRVSAVTLYPDGATVTREVPFTAPVGAHRSDPCRSAARHAACLGAGGDRGRALGRDHDARRLRAAA